MRWMLFSILMAQYPQRLVLLPFWGADCRREVSIAHFLGVQQALLQKKISENLHEVGRGFVGCFDLDEADTHRFEGVGSVLTNAVKGS